MPGAPTSIICCAGGGLQASFIAGAMSRFESLFPSQMAATNHIFATSASVATMFYYLSFGANHSGEKIWTKDIPTSAFFTSIKNLRNGTPVYDVDHLIDVVFKQNNPLDIHRIRNTSINFVFPALNLQTRQTELFSNKPELARAMFPTSTIRNWLDFDIYELMRAALAIPILYDRPVQLGNHTYCDAGLLQPFLIPHKLQAHTRALYIMVRQKPNFSDIKLQFIASLWRLRALRGKAGLPGWLYTRLMLKPIMLPIVCRRLAKRVPNLTLISARTSLASLLHSNHAAALHNWRTGESHITARQSEIQTNFWGQ